MLIFDKVWQQLNGSPLPSLSANQERFLDFATGSALLVALILIILVVNHVMGHMGRGQFIDPAAGYAALMSPPSSDGKSRGAASGKSKKKVHFEAGEDPSMEFVAAPQGGFGRMPTDAGSPAPGGPRAQGDMRAPAGTPRANRMAEEERASLEVVNGGGLSVGETPSRPAPAGGPLSDAALAASLY
jgi:hypothetical protein